MNRIVVTGTRGYLGGAIARHLRSRGHEVVEIGGSAGFAETLQAAVAPGADALIHAGFRVRFAGCGTQTPADPPNLASARLVAAACQEGRVGHLIFVGAAGVCGVSGSAEELRGERCAGTTAPNFESYLRTEYIQEKLAATGILRNCIPSVAVLHPSTVYGPGMQAEVLRELNGGRVKVVPPGGTSGVALRDFLLAVDLVLEKRARGTWIVNGENFPYRSLFRWAARTKNRFQLPLPMLLEPLFRWLAQSPWGANRGLAVHHSAFGFKYYSSSRIRHELGWEPQTTVAEALKEALDGGGPSR